MNGARLARALFAILGHCFSYGVLAGCNHSCIGLTRHDLDSGGASACADHLPYLCRRLLFGPVAEVAEAGAAGGGGETGGAEVEESAEDVVVHAADFSRFAALLPALAGEAEVEIDFQIGRAPR